MNTGCLRTDRAPKEEADFNVLLTVTGDRRGRESTNKHRVSETRRMYGKQKYFDKDETVDARSVDLAGCHAGGMF